MQKKKKKNMIINVKVKTNSKKNEIIKTFDNSYIIKTTAMPENGKANKNVIDILSKYFKVGKNKVKILKGITSHNKIVKLEL